MAIKDLVGSATAAIDAQILADLTALGWTKPLSVGLGMSKDFTFNASPSVIWVPNNDRYEPRQVASIRPASIANNASLRAVHTRWAGLEARIWAVYSDQPSPPSAEDYSATEVLLNVVLMAVHKTVPGNYQLGGGSWQDFQGAEDMVLGRAYCQQLWISIPIYDAAGVASQQQLTTLPLTRQVVNPDASTESDLP